MQSGYRYNRDAQAKALRIAVKNSKKDKVLYGAVIKAESGFQSTAPTITVASNGTTGTTNSSTQKELQERQAMGSNDVNATLLKKLQERALILDATVRPQDSNSNAGSPRSVSSTQSKAFSEPMNAKPRADVGGPRIPLNLVDELKAQLTKGNFGLRPRDSRQSNVSVGTPSSVGTPTSSVPSDATSTIAPIDRTPPVAVNTRNRLESTMTIGSEYSDSLPIGSATIGSTEDMNTDQVLPKAHDERTEEVKVVSIRDKAIQDDATKLYHHLQDIRNTRGAKESMSETMTPYSKSGTAVPKYRLKMTYNSNKSYFSFQMIHDDTKASKTLKNNNDLGVDLFQTLKIADGRADGQYRPEDIGKVGLTNGLGIAADHIGSSRVVYKSRKGGHGLTKNQLYLMEPQLIKGHIRLYNKSGRPVVSRSNVSPQFQRIAKDIVDRNTFEADDYSNVDPKESADVNKFIEATKPIQPRNINRLSNADTIWQLKKRYEVLVGELSAGNTGKVVRDEMETILRNLIRLHALNQDKGRELIRSLRDF